MRHYLDTSAALKLVVAEPESASLRSHLALLPPDDVVLASWLLHTELTCAAARRSRGIPERLLAAILESITLVDLVRADLLEASRSGGGLRSQDALHLTVALRTGCEAILTYDHEQADAARALGLRVDQPS